MNYEIVNLKPEPSYLAPDGSEIYVLVEGSKGSLCQCILPVGKSFPVAHKSIEELWFFLEGEGEVYREGLGENDLLEVSAGSSLVIPAATTFQFRNVGQVPLKFIIATIPPWPGKDEAITEVAGKWDIS